MLNHGTFISKLKRQEGIYAKLKESCTEELWRIEDKQLFNEIIEQFGPKLNPESAQYDLMSIYDIAYHRRSGALIIANKGATLYALAPRTQAPYITRHIGICVYLPHHGIEVVNVGLVGDVYKGPVVLRSESACTPSFLFGSQRCNCAHQWDVMREVVARFNPASPPSIECGKAFEQWVQTQFAHEAHCHHPKESGQGFILMHLDTQNGMGSGYTEGEFSYDLFSRASLRHRGEYTSEQVWQTTMAGGFEAIGIEPDPRKQNGGSGYQVTPIILDYLGTSKDLIFLSNNPLKIAALESHNYHVTRVKSIGEVSAAGAQEAFERGVEFNHMDIDATHITFDEELHRLCEEITELTCERMEAAAC